MSEGQPVLPITNLKLLLPEEISGFINDDPQLNAIADVKRWTWKASRIKRHGRRYLRLQAVFLTPDDRRLACQAEIQNSYLLRARMRASKAHVQSIVEELLAFWQEEHPTWRGKSVSRAILMQRFSVSLSPQGDKDHHDPLASPPAS